MRQGKRSSGKRRDYGEAQVGLGPLTPHFAPVWQNPDGLWYWPSCTSAPVHTRRILLPGLATRFLSRSPSCVLIVFQRTSVPVLTRRTLLSGLATRSLPSSIYCLLTVHQYVRPPATYESA